MKNLSTKAIMIMLSVMSVAIVALTVAVIGLASGRTEEQKETPAATQKAAEGSEPVSLPEPEGSTEESTTEPESGLKEHALMEVPTLPETSEKERPEETAPDAQETEKEIPKETEKEHQKETKEKETKEKETQPKETKEKKTEPAETEPKETKEKETRPAETVTEPENTEWEDPWTDPEDTEREDPWADPEDTDPEDPWTDPEDTDPEDPWTDPEDTEWEYPDTEHIHDFSDWVTVKEPTCTNPGTEKAVCECGAEMTHEMQPLGHSMGDWDEIDPPTVDSEGLMMRSCSRCGMEETKSIPRLEPEDQYRKVSVSIATVKNGGIYYKINGKYYEVKIGERTDTTGSWTTIISYYANGQFLMEQFIPHGAYSTTCALSPIYTKK